MLEEGNVSLKLKGSQEDLRKIPNHSWTHRELKEKTRPGRGVCGDITANHGLEFSGASPNLGSQSDTGRTKRGELRL